MNLTRRQLPAALAATALLPACSDGIDVAEWTEEVKLHDGQIVTVWRRARAGSSGFPNANRGALVDTELRYAPLDVRWKSTIYRNPCSFELFDGVPHLTVFATDREYCRSKPRTDFAAQFMRWSGIDWTDIAQKDFPTERAIMNLSLQYWGHSTADDYKGHIRWDAKRLPGKREPADTVQIYFERTGNNCGMVHAA